jgi:hypothetical protein
MFKFHFKSQLFLPVFGSLMVLALVASTLAFAAPPTANEPNGANQSFNLSHIPTGNQKDKRVESLTPGQSIKLEGGSDVRIVSSDGRIQITSKEGSVILFEGFVKNESKPWLTDHPVLASETTEAAQTARPKLVPQFKIDLGQAEVEVVPGQEMRLASPLIISAVRGTKFSMSVAKDGSSALNVLEGKVLSMARNGKVELLEAGKAVELSAAKFTEFLKGLNVKIPEGGDWRKVDSKVLTETVQTAFGDALDILNPVEIKTPAAPKVELAKVLDATAKGPANALPPAEGKYPRKDMAAKP